jgi:hypothetical protein
MLEVLVLFEEDVEDENEPVMLESPSELVR